VITVFRSITGRPQRDDLDLTTLYAGYAAGAIERDRLLEQVTARNRVLETIRVVLQTLAGPVGVAKGLIVALDALRDGLSADELALVTLPGSDPDGVAVTRAYSGAAGIIPPATLTRAEAVLAAGGVDCGARPELAAEADRALSITFTAPQGNTVLLACWHGAPSLQPTLPDDNAAALIEDAAHSFRLALERESASAAHQEAMALRQSQEMQHAFLRRLNHELRTPLTAITGYASSLLQQDVTWDAESEQRFLSRISAESSRLGRLVNDLLDFSAIESGIFRLQSDWCDLPLVIDAAVALLPPRDAPFVEVKTAPDLPTIWADHDRLEQVFVNLLGNALAHNPQGTRVTVTAEACAAGAEEAAAVTIRVTDDGQGMPPELLDAPAIATAARRPRKRGESVGAGLGLSIARGIVAAHGGVMELEHVPRGTSFRITLPVENPAQKTTEKANDYAE
jgi:signal transduction histidine kinase